MQELDDNALLRAYVERASEEAFATLVERHVNKVYSTALRHTRHPSQAEEITQAVFVILARKARQLGRGVILSGWLYQTARLTSVTFIRGEIRRARREQEAHMQKISHGEDSALWQQVSPMLDAAMGELNEADRNAVALRFFDGKSMKDIGMTMGTSEEASKKRVNRALEKLQKFFRRRGVDSTASSLERTISAHSIQAAPAMLAKAAVTAAIAKGAAMGGSTTPLAQAAMKVMAWAKMKMAIAVSAGALLAIGGGSAVYEIHRHLQRADDGGIGAATIPNGPADLTLKWNAGQRYPMRVELRQNNEMPLPNQASVKTVVNFSENFDIVPLEKLAAGGWKLEIEFRKITVGIDQQGRTIMNVDSDATAAGAPNPAAAIVGGKLECYTDIHGDVTKVDGMSELVARMGGDSKSQEQSIFQQFFSDSSIKQFLAMGTTVPGRVVNVGEEWPIKKDIETAAGLIAVTLKANFKNWERHNGHTCAHLKTSGEFSTKGSSAASGVIMEIQKAKALGDVWFDPAAGAVVELDSDQNINMKITTQAQSVITSVQQSVRLLWLAEQ